MRDKLYIQVYTQKQKEQNKSNINAGGWDDNTELNKISLFLYRYDIIG